MPSVASRRMDARPAPASWRPSSMRPTHRRPQPRSAGARPPALTAAGLSPPARVRRRSGEPALRSPLVEHVRQQLVGPLVVGHRAGPARASRADGDGRGGPLQVRVHGRRDRHVRHRQEAVRHVQQPVERAAPRRHVDRARDAERREREHAPARRASQSASPSSPHPSGRRGHDEDRGDRHEGRGCGHRRARIGVLADRCLLDGQVRPRQLVEDVGHAPECASASGP